MSSPDPVAQIPPKSQPEFGRRLRQLRLDRGLSQTDLAGDRLSPSAISLLEAGRREPTLRTLGLLANQLSCAVEHLLGNAAAPAEQNWRLDFLHAEIVLRVGDFAEALRRFDALSDSGAADLYIRQRARLARAVALEGLGRTADAITEVEELAREQDSSANGVPWLDADVVRARCYQKTGRHDESLSLTRRSLELVEPLGLVGMAGHSELVIILITELHEHGLIAEAAAIAAEHLSGPISGSSPDRAERYFAASVRAAEAGNLAEAVSLAERALAQYADIADSRTGALLNVVAANAVLAGAEPPLTAMEVGLNRAYLVIGLVGTLSDRALCQVTLAVTYFLLGKGTECTAWASLVLEEAVGGANIKVAKARLVLAQQHLVDGARDVAAAEAEQAARALTALGDLRVAAPVWVELARVHRSLGDAEAALAAFEHAVTGASLPVLRTQ